MSASGAWHSVSSVGMSAESSALVILKRKRRHSSGPRCHCLDSSSETPRTPHTCIAICSHSPHYLSDSGLERRLSLFGVRDQKARRHEFRNASARGTLLLGLGLAIRHRRDHRARCQRLSQAQLQDARVTVVCRFFCFPVACAFFVVGKLNCPAAEPPAQAPWLIWLCGAQTGITREEMHQRYLGLRGNAPKPPMACTE